MTSTTLQTRAVLAGAYRGQNEEHPAYLTHTVDTVLGDRPLCKRVKESSIADEFADDIHAAPTCPICLARDARFNGGK